MTDTSVAEKNNVDLSSDNEIFEGDSTLYNVSVLNVHKTIKKLFLTNKSKDTPQGVGRRLEASATFKKGRSDFGVERIDPNEQWFRFYSYISPGQNDIFVSSQKDGSDYKVYGLNGSSSGMDDRNIFTLKQVNKSEPNKFYIICKHNSEVLFCSNTTDGKDNGIQAYTGALGKKSGRDVFTFDKVRQGQLHKSYEA